MKDKLIIMTENIILIQKLIRGFLSRKNNIFYNFKKTKIIENFKKEIIGYHILCNEVIKESKWEEINKNIIDSHHNINYISNGNHSSGIDTIIEKWKISNKTSKIERNKINISSYRLTNVCSNKKIGDEKNILNEIIKRDNSFNFFSILLRKEEKNKLTYFWLIIPKEFFIFKITNKKLYKKYGKIGKNKNEIIGWYSTFFDITFSMSSQLWFHFNFDEIKKYIITSTCIDLKILPKIKYSNIYDFYFF